ncbi:multi antimicrobial extrusion protein MatE [Paenibacillus sp. y28]|uniref:multi antimicrobial extrusion protein MatE n=1 Tax=Paenibacillus sp. y28 TaxID=3129110 RepID=UPI00301B5516
MNTRSASVRLTDIFKFFIPLGISASLVTMSHSIINSTLARSANPELIISSYAIAMSVLSITERPAVLLRQTCSALVRDKRSYRAMNSVATIVLGTIIVLGLLLSYTPVGHWLFTGLLNVDEELLPSVLNVYRILMVVSIFSGIRCLFHGIIIVNMRTKWLTIGMVIRLLAMYAVSQLFIQTNSVSGGWVGAFIFAVGMIVEALVAFLEGRKLANRLPERLEDHSVQTRRDVFRFYRPLLYSGVIAIIIAPTINAMLGKTGNMQLAIASFAIAANMTQLMQSFFSYIHQIVLNFYRKDPGQVRRFMLLCSLLPTALLAAVGYTELGPLFLKHVIGVSDQLLDESIKAIRMFMLTTLIFPWLDYMNGQVMLNGQTKIMAWSQAANVTITVLSLIVFVAIAPQWNAVIGALAQSLGVAAELGVVLFGMYQVGKLRGRVAGGL